MKVRISKEEYDRVYTEHGPISEMPRFMEIEAEPLTATEKHCEKCSIPLGMSNPPSFTCWNTCDCHKPMEKASDFSEFIRKAYPEEKKRVWEEIAREASADQQKSLRENPVPPKAEEITRCTTDNPCLIFSKTAPPLKEIEELERGERGSALPLEGMFYKINELVKAVNELRK